MTEKEGCFDQVSHNTCLYPMALDSIDYCMCAVVRLGSNTTVVIVRTLLHIHTGNEEMMRGEMRVGNEMPYTTQTCY